MGLTLLARSLVGAAAVLRFRIARRLRRCSARRGAVLLVFEGQRFHANIMVLAHLQDIELSLVQIPETRERGVNGARRNAGYPGQPKTDIRFAMQLGEVLVVQSRERGFFRAVLVLQPSGRLRNVLDSLRAIFQPPQPVDLFDRGREIADLQGETIFEPLAFQRLVPQQGGQMVGAGATDLIFETALLLLALAIKTRPQMLVGQPGDDPVRR